MILTLYLNTGVFLLVITVNEAKAGQKVAVEELLTASPVAEKVIMGLRKLMPSNGHQQSKQDFAIINWLKLDSPEVGLHNEPSTNVNLPKIDLLTKTLPKTDSSNSFLPKLDSLKIDLLTEKLSIEDFSKLVLLDPEQFKLDFPRLELSKLGFKFSPQLNSPRTDLSNYDSREKNVPKPNLTKLDSTAVDMLEQDLPKFLKLVAPKLDPTKLDSSKVDLVKLKSPETQNQLQVLQKLGALGADVQKQNSPISTNVTAVKSDPTKLNSLKRDFPELWSVVTDFASLDSSKLDSPQFELPKLDQPNPISWKSVLRKPIVFSLLESTNIRNTPSNPQTLATTATKSKSAPSKIKNQFTNFPESKSFETDVPRLDIPKLDSFQLESPGLDQPNPISLNPLLRNPIIFHLFNPTKMKNTPSTPQALATRAPKSKSAPSRSKDHVAKLVNEITSINCRRWRQLEKPPTTPRRFRRLRDEPRSPTGPIDYVDFPDSSSTSSSSISSFSSSPSSHSGGNRSPNAQKRKATDDPEDDSEDEDEVDSMMVDEFKKATFGDRRDKRPRA